MSSRKVSLARKLKEREIKSGVLARWNQGKEGICREELCQ